MRVFDTSHYCQNEVVDNYLLQVLPVNKAVWITFHVKKGFSVALNSSNLNYNRASTTTDLVDLPDGIYEMKLSYKPNSYTLVQYSHFRITTIVLKIRNERDKVYSNKCNLSKEEFKANLAKLDDIEGYVNAAKFKVEEKLEKRQGIELYQWATKLLEQYTNECQC